MPMWKAHVVVVVVVDVGVATHYNEHDAGEIRVAGASGSTISWDGTKCDTDIDYMRFY